MPPVKRRSYTAGYKTEVLKYAEEHGNRAAGRHYNISEKLCRAWKQVPTKNITSGFSKAEITTGSPDADIDIDEDEPMDVSDDYRLTPELAALFNSDTEDEEFNGFTDDFVASDWCVKWQFQNNYVTIQMIVIILQKVLIYMLWTIY